MTGHYCDLCGASVPCEPGCLSMVRRAPMYGAPFGNACDSCAEIIYKAASDAAANLRINPVLPTRLEPQKASEQ